MKPPPDDRRLRYDALPQPPRFSPACPTSRAADVPVETELLDGDVGPAILPAARRCAADLVVVGGSAHFATGEPYVGTQTRHLLEFTDQPVLVVPHGER